MTRQQDADPLLQPLDGYRPSEGEPYMNERQLAYFYQRLLAWRRELTEASRMTLDELRNASRDVGDDGDQSSELEIQTLELRTRDRYRKLIRKIDAALKRIRTGDYGYCEMTGEAIGLRRLEARPIANLSVAAQERKEFVERHAGA